MTRTYGRKVPAPLPAHRMLSRTTPGLPVAVDGEASCGQIKDQGALGSCTGHAFASAIEWIFRKYLGKKPVLSPLYLYAWELIQDGNFPNDDGSDGVTGCNVSILKGCCEDALYPDASGKIAQPTAVQDANASQYRLGAYHGLTGSEVALSVLGDATPWPVEVGFTAYESFEGDELAKTGVMPVPKPSEAVLGGHEVLMVGYDVSATPKLRPAGCPQAALIMNSWGAGCGLSGFFWLPLPILDAVDTDLKIDNAGHPRK